MGQAIADWWKAGYGKESKNGISESLWALGFVITQGVALVVAVQDTERRSSIVSARGFTFERVVDTSVDQLDTKPSHWSFSSRIGIYRWVSIATIGAVVGMIFARKKEHGSGGWIKSYDHSTRFFTLCVLVWTILFVYIFDAAAREGVLPGQVIDVQASEFHPHNFKRDEEAGVRVLVKIRVLEFPGSANVMRFEAMLNQTLHERWYITEGNAFKGDYHNDETRDEEADAPIQQNSDEKRFAIIKLQEMEIGEEYTFVFWLRARDKQPAPAMDREDVLSYLRTEEKAFRFKLHETEPAGKTSRNP